MCEIQKQNKTYSHIAVISRDVDENPTLLIHFHSWEKISNSIPQWKLPKQLQKVLAGISGVHSDTTSQTLTEWPSYSLREGVREVWCTGKSRLEPNLVLVWHWHCRKHLNSNMIETSCVELVCTKLHSCHPHSGFTPAYHPNSIYLMFEWCFDSIYV